MTETGYDVGNTEKIGAESDTSLLGNRPKNNPPAGEQPPVKPVDNKPPGNLPPKQATPAPKKTGSNQ